MRNCHQRRWHLDEVFVKINGERHYLWRTVDHDGEVLESFVAKQRDKKAAVKFLSKSMRRHGSPEVLVTDKLLSYGAAMKEIGNAERQETGRWATNRAENSHQPFRRRERAILRLMRMRRLQKSAALHGSVHAHFNQERHLYDDQISSRTVPPLSPSGVNFVPHRFMPIATNSDWSELV
jgi:putative transposase